MELSHQSGRGLYPIQRLVWGSMTRSLLVALGLPLLMGCGSGLADVSGTVTYDGKPLAGGGGVRGTVTFARADGLGTPAVGILVDNVRNELWTRAAKGAVPGRDM